MAPKNPFSHSIPLSVNELVSTILLRHGARARLIKILCSVWFTDGADFQSWVSQDRSNLWIYGIAGAGKTILMSSIIQELEKRTGPEDGKLIAIALQAALTRDIALAFFYCDYKDIATHSHIAILGALARQLVAQKEECFADLQQFYQDHFTQDRSLRTPSPEELHELIRTVSTHFQNTMVVVDGLDEISDDRAGVSKLLRSLSDSSRSIKTLFASRPEVDIGYALEGCDRISISAKSSDLHLYVGAEIQRRTEERKLNIRDPTLKEHIMETLVNGADGINLTKHKLGFDGLRAKWIISASVAVIEIAVKLFTSSLQTYRALTSESLKGSIVATSRIND
ncbi:Vegetative incompatibility protein HET-E-1 [Lachnellula suecica]|uniref:Vegetative incompatibility protein HET-E-1 n=1 Tax=Lachnellula suecica TaxID=602035 RepID=A0A8T9CI56_9HELO|nr:Vegetative incompatibility protein HET-E-1 [Lachnellula suecica]